MLNSMVEIRKEILDKLRKQSASEKSRKDRIIEKRLFSCVEFKKSHAVMFYVSKEEEVNTHRMIKEALATGKRVAVPYSVSETRQIIASELKDPKKDLEIGPYGINQPRKDTLREMPLEDIDLVVVPGVAFDEKNNRLGRGKGYYDKFLKELSPGTLTIGLCFDFQIVKDLPKEAHDFPVLKVVTN